MLSDSRDIKFNRDEEFRFSSVVQGEKVFFFRRVVSTMDVAAEMIKEGISGIVVAQKQESGRGRYGRNWLSMPGGLYFSWALREESAGYPFSEITAVALVETIRFFGVTCNIKFPNDIITDTNKKVAGILIEKKGDFYNIGVGVNVNNLVTPLAAGTSIMEITGKPVENIENVLERFIVFFKSGRKLFLEDADAYLKKWSDNLIK